MVDNLSLVHLSRDGTPPTPGNVVIAHCGSGDCFHQWIVAYLPMPLEKAALLMQRAACPKCANTRPTVGGNA